ncbi:RNA polymerase factor sigma-54 [Aquisalinus flavus]|uniref:RNA polymerase factor sigma-54 n=1 Tax=Aquisalinus flavus TaxID=1526572 RepID=UPI00165F3740|nr:RNA polymerase factor sigma-54 [Aquisalinus flavus]MBD0425809.1 RNA polymerase factor sigma-54 [Aquisalinus flavus]UNE48585.1 RNA polymerase factor sigma-54 [Aquisalinus flavus]
MALSPKLEMRQGQQLVMTPQLQQAIKLLQLTNLELQEFVETQLLENPFLERDERASKPERGDGAATTREDGQSKSADSEISFENGHSSQADQSIDSDYDSVDPDASRAEKLETQRADASLTDWSSTGQRQSGDYSDLDSAANISREKTLHDHLTDQLMLATRNEVERLIGAHLIDMIDEGGYLRADIQEVADRLGISHQDVRRVLTYIQGFEPAGVGARNLQECLKLQLIDRGRFDGEMERFLENLHLLGAANRIGLRRATGLGEPRIVQLITEVRSLTPKPGYAFGRDDLQVVIPDVIVTEGDDGGWRVELNAETLPKVLANRQYFARLSTDRKLPENDKTYLSEQMASANWLVKSLDQRARTILKVASEIIRKQDAFLLQGVRYLRPLNLKAVAEAISMHESTVSRVTANKYIQTPRGIFELKYFFTASIAAATGEVTHSAEAVRYRIRELIDAEDPDAILSDDRIVELLKIENIDIARRTVAKYREAMHIPSSVQRRRMKKQAI